MFDTQNVRDIISRRTSTRTFSGNRLSDEQIWEIKNFINSLDNRKGIFGSVRFELVENKNDTVFGAYGDITGAVHYLVAVVRDNRQSLLDAGYAFERTILFAESIGLGTCWLAATSFDRNEAEIRVGLEEGEIIAAISPIGEKALKKTKAELDERKKLKSDDRLDFDMLFACAMTGGKIEDEKTRENLQAVRIAPSALNNQPWRVIMDENVAHFYVIRKFFLPLDYDVQMLDIGAALYHYSMVANKHDFFQKNPHSKNELEYIISVR